MNRYLGCPTAHWKAMSIACGEHLTVVFFLQALHLKYLMLVEKKPRTYFGCNLRNLSPAVT